MSDPLALKNCIDGAWAASTSGESVENINPANVDDVIGSAPQSTREEARAAIEAAARAFPAWRDTPAPDRARVFARAHRIATDRVDELAAILTREEGKVLSEARGEILKGLNLVEYFAGQGMRLYGRTTPSEMPHTLTYTIRQPMGVVALITPWNFPWAIPAWKTAPALIAGNTAVFKPASLTPHTAVKWVEILHEAGIPDGVMNMVMGAGRSVGEELVTNPTIKAISFTGSTGVGSRLYTQASEHLAKVTCEMGGKNPIFVMNDADLEQAVEGIVQGAFGSTGQRCTATSRVVVMDEVADELTAAIVARAKAFVVGNGMTEGVTMGPAVDDSQLQTNLEYIGIAMDEGAKLECGGDRLTDGDLAKGFFVTPTVFSDVKQSMRIAREEVFGPVLSVIRVGSFDEGVEVCNDVDFGLTASIYANDPNAILRFVDRSEVGMVHVNSPTVGGEAQLPFGGIKATGVGDREMAEEGINFFTELKTVFFDYTGAKRETNIY